MKKGVKIGILALTVIAAVVFAAFSATRPLKLPVLTVSASLWESTVSEEGVSTAPESGEVFTKNGGLVKAVFIEEDARVKAGDPLVEFSDTELVLALEGFYAQTQALEGERRQAAGAALQLDVQADAVRVQIEGARGALLSAEAQLEAANTALLALRDTYQDIELLYELGEASLRELEDVGTAVKTQELAASSAESAKAAAEAQIDALSGQLGTILAAKGQGNAGALQAIDAQLRSLEASIRDLERKREETLILAPFDGRAGVLIAEEGMTLPPGANLLTLTGEGFCEVECLLRVKDAYGISVGNEVIAELSLRDGELRFSGVVSEIAPEAKETLSALGIPERRVKVTVLVSEPGWEEIKPGYPLDLTFILSRAENVVAIPKTALFETEDGFAVYVVKDGRTVCRPVVRGDESTASVVITEGLLPGEVILKDAEDDRVSEGIRVAVLP